MSKILPPFPNERIALQKERQIERPVEHWIEHRMEYREKPNNPHVNFMFPFSI
jgi:hypothetical protein